VVREGGEADMKRIWVSDMTNFMINELVKETGLKKYDVVMLAISKWYENKII
jgi:hypothetical protein